MTQNKPPTPPTDFNPSLVPLATDMDSKQQSAGQDSNTNTNEAQPSCSKASASVDSGTHSASEAPFEVNNAQTGSASSYACAPEAVSSPTSAAAPVMSTQSQAPSGKGIVAQVFSPAYFFKILALLIVILSFAFLFSLQHSCSKSLSGLTDLAGSGEAYEGKTATPSVGVIDIDGEIGYNGSTSSPDGLRHLLDLAEEDNNIKAIVLRVNSGGGSATAGEEMAYLLKKFSKPVVVSSQAINASAAYEISSQAQYIFVNKTTEIGSIGTIIQLTDLSGLYEKLGIKKTNIASAGSKDSSYGNRPLTPEERAYYQRHIEQVNQTFLDNVAAGRNLSMDQVKALATGLTWSGIEAVENKSADALGYFEDALNKAAELGGLKEYDVQDLTLASKDSSLFDLSNIGDFL